MSTKTVLALVFGLILISIQLSMPDLVPKYILNLLSQNISHFTGLEPVLEANLLLWLFGGWALVFGGIFATIRSLGRQSEYIY